MTKLSIKKRTEWTYEHGVWTRPTAKPKNDKRPLPAPSHLGPIMRRKLGLLPKK